MFDEKYKPCPKRENTKKPGKNKNVKNMITADQKNDKKFIKYQSALLFYRDYCALFDEMLTLPEY
jgi:hypothetical protein